MVGAKGSFGMSPYVGYREMIAGAQFTSSFRQSLRVLSPGWFQIQFSWQRRSTTFCPPCFLVTRLHLGMGSRVCVLWSNRAHMNTNNHGSCSNLGGTNQSLGKQKCKLWGSLGLLRRSEVAIQILRGGKTLVKLDKLFYVHEPTVVTSGLFCREFPSLSICTTLAFKGVDLQTSSLSCEAAGFQWVLPALRALERNLRH